MAHRLQKGKCMRKRFIINVRGSFECSMGLTIAPIATQKTLNRIMKRNTRALALKFVKTETHIALEKT